MNLSFIGGGAMAEAMIRGVLSQSLAKPENIYVGEISEERCRYLCDTYRIFASPRNDVAASKGELVVLAVKPQNFHDVAPDLRSCLSPNQTVLSIIAGLPMSTLTGELVHAAAIRVMPNTPAQIGAGMTLWLCAPSVSEDAASHAEAILTTLGDQMRVDREAYIDMATALSASGPAYVFLFIESLIDAGVHLGMPRPMASRLTLQTVLGSVRLVQETASHPAELKNMVTSPGGTTAAALMALEEESFRATVMKAVVAAHRRSVELSEE